MTKFILTTKWSIGVIYHTVTFYTGELFYGSFCVYHPLCADTLTCYTIISDNFQYFLGKNHGSWLGPLEKKNVRSWLFFNSGGRGGIIIWTFFSEFWNPLCTQILTFLKSKYRLSSDNFKLFSKAEFFFQNTDWFCQKCDFFQNSKRHQNSLLLIIHSKGILASQLHQIFMLGWFRGDVLHESAPASARSCLSTQRSPPAIYYLGNKPTDIVQISLKPTCLFGCC